MKLSVIVIAKNEQQHIAACLTSVAFADEIIVIDDHSSDDTAELARAAGATVYQRAMNGDFAAQQNFAIEKAQGQWLLFIDCDERTTPALATEIQAVIQQSPQPACAYRLRRLNHFAGQRVRFGTLRPDSVVRLIPNDNVHFAGRVHQTLQHRFSEKTLAQPMLHYTYASWSQYYQKFEQYTRISAQQMAERGKRVAFFRDILLRPQWAFFKMYIVHGGFLDGKIGWLLAINHYHYTQAKYARLLAIQTHGEDSV